jgi:outer membrane protein assembly factor BamB
LYVSSPAVSGGLEDEVVFSGDNAGVEHAYRLSDGTELLRISSKTGAKIQSSAAVSDGKVFFGCADGRIYAIG